MNLLKYTVFVAIMLNGVASASVFYTNQTIFRTVLRAPTTVNFAGIAPIGFYVDSNGGTSTITVGALDFSDGPTDGLIPRPPVDDSRDQNLVVVDPGYSQGDVFPWAVLGAPVLNDNKNPSVINIAPHSGSFTFLGAGMSISIQGFFDEMGPVTVADTGTITLSDGEFATFSLDSTVRSFIGFTSTSSISSFTISTQGFGLLTSYVEYSAEPVSESISPEPCTIALIGSALSLLALRRAKPKSQKV